MEVTINYNGQAVAVEVTPVSYTHLSDTAQAVRILERNFHENHFLQMQLQFSPQADQGCAGADCGLSLIHI